MMPLQTPSLELIQEARRRIAGHIVRTPLVPFHGETSEARIYLKLENLQPTGSFKVRGAAAAMLLASREELAHGVWTASAGNMAQGVARFARQMGLPCSVVVPDDAPLTKLKAIASLGARILPLPFHEYQQVQREHKLEGISGLLLHPFADTHVMAGNASLAVEILEDLPDIDIVMAPFGGGGLSCGIACALRLLKPPVRVYACEVATAAPLAASLAAHKPVEIPFTPSFVSGMGAPFVFPQMWPLASRLLDGSEVVSLEQVARSIQLLAFHNHILAEAAGAVAVAAALALQAGPVKIACIVSGGNIDIDLLTRILHGETP